MKMNCLLYFLFASSAYAMQPDAGTLALLKAIKKSDIKEFEQLVAYFTKPESFANLESLRLLLGRSKLDTNQISDTSTRMKKYAQEQAGSLCNPSFYKNMGISLACFGSAAALTGLFLWIPLSNHEFDFLKNGLTIGSTVSILTVLGARHMKNALKNEDAVNEYAKQLAIKYFVQKIIPFNQREHA